MTLSLIEYLESKDFEVPEIQLLEKRYFNSSKDDAEIIKKFDTIYKVFDFAGLSVQQVNKVIINNISMLSMHDHEIIRVIYTWFKAGLITEIIDKKRGINSSKYIRSFLRNEYLNSNIRTLNSPISYNALIMGDEEFQRDYIGKINGTTFYPSEDNLVAIFGQGDTLEDRRKFIESKVGALSLSWFLDCLKKEKQKNARKSL